MTLAVLMLLCYEPLTYTVDVCELNHIRFGVGQPVVSYWVWLDWDWHYEHGYDYYVRDWRCEAEVPHPIRGVQEWQDKRTKRRLRVASRIFTESWTTYDREIEDRKRVAEQDRRRFGVQ